MAERHRRFSSRGRVFRSEREGGCREPDSLWGELGNMLSVCKPREQLLRLKAEKVSENMHGFIQ